MRPVSQSGDAFRSVTTLVSDVDDTITSDGRLLPCALEAMYRLERAGVRLVLLTGGSAGWSDVYIRQWPVSCVIAESGAVCLTKDERGQIVYRTNPVIRPEEIKKREAFLSSLDKEKLSSDQYARLHDIAADLSKCSGCELEEIKRKALENGAFMAQSSIHLNIWFSPYSKLQGLDAFIGSDRRSMAYIGDSLPDEPMFASFPLSAGTKRVADNQKSFSHLPSYVCSFYGGEGFAELAERIIG